MFLEFLHTFNDLLKELYWFMFTKISSLLLFEILSQIIIIAIFQEQEQIIRCPRYTIKLHNIWILVFKKNKRAKHYDCSVCYAKKQHKMSLIFHMHTLAVKFLEILDLFIDQLFHFFWTVLKMKLLHCNLLFFIFFELSSEHCSRSALAKSFVENNELVNFFGCPITLFNHFGFSLSICFCN